VTWQAYVTSSRRKGTNSLTGGTFTNRPGRQDGQRRRIDIQTDLGIRRTRSSGREEEGRVRNNQDCVLDREEKGLEEKKERQAR
jgi:hypothetical protein